MRTLEYTETGELSIVRSNMMEDPNYTPYCGSSCIVRTQWINNQFKCPRCGYTTEFPEAFINKYKEKYKL